MNMPTPAHYRGVQVLGTSTLLRHFPGAPDSRLQGPVIGRIPVCIAQSTIVSGLVVAIVAPNQPKGKGNRLGCQQPPASGRLSVGTLQGRLLPLSRHWLKAGNAGGWGQNTQEPGSETRSRRGVGITPSVALVALGESRFLRLIQIPRISLDRELRI